jgi:hypothetical protein
MAEKYTGRDWQKKKSVFSSFSSPSSPLFPQAQGGSSV